jgi:hypothetical protein
MKRSSLWTLGVVLLAAVVESRGAEDKPAARPLANHPGNVFLAGEEVVVRLSAEDGTKWEAADYDGKPVAIGAVLGGKARLGRLPVGYYELRQGGAATATAIGVLAPLRSPVSPSSPIAIDLAMSWFYQTAAQKAAAASLCKLAGAAWVRDRMTWGEIEPGRQDFARETRYDESARLQSEAGLRVLQVYHSTPAWAGGSFKRFPEDLRDVYGFLRHAAARWKGRVQAFEPWNEADIDMFGGHTGAEMASLQKAAYWGIKAGNPDAIACLNVFAVARPDTLDDFAANVAWPYFDTCNLHHYIRPDDYPAWYAAFRRISAGRPLWVTEFSQPVPWAGDPKAQEPTAEDQRLQARRVPIVFASSLHEGPAEAFYFLFPHYTEGKIQFGVVHRDLTPRPAYVAFAAAGRLLAEARPLGSWKVASRQARAFFFRARPDGQDAEVMVAWTTEPHGDLELPVAPAALFDHLGRSMPPAGTVLRLSLAPIYAVLPPGTAQRLTLAGPPTMPPRQEAKPSPVVLQAVWPRDRVALEKSAYRVVAGEDVTVSVFAYNFSDSPVTGKLTVAAPSGWEVSIPDRVELAAGQRKQLALSIHRPAAKGEGPEKIQLTGDFGPAGSTFLSIRLQLEPKKV